MTIEHPIVAVTGASGAGTTSVQAVFKSICEGSKISATFVEGDSFHRYERDDMRELIDAWERTAGRSISHFGPEANLLDELESLFRDYGQEGCGRIRQYLHEEKNARRYGQKPGSFSPWEQIPPNTDLLLYEGLHGGVITKEVNIVQHVDLLIGVTPTINLEWIQKLHRDQRDRGHTINDVTETILRRMPDYVEHIVPQFSRTDINFQRVPTVDTSNPFSNTGIPNPEQSLIVVRFAHPDPEEIDVLASKITNSFQSREDCLVVPGNVYEQVLREVLAPRLIKLVQQSRSKKP